MRVSAPFAGLKRHVADILASRPIGQLIGFLYQDRIPSRDCVIATDHPSVTPRAKAMILFGRYESAEARFVDRYLRRDLDTVDLGASIGVISSLIGRRLAPSVRLVCVEADPSLHDILSRNLKMNVSGLQTAIVSGAIDYSGRSMTSLVLGGDNLTASAVTQGSQRVEVQSVQLSAILGSHGIMGPYQLVMDIEGSEVGLLRFDGEALARCQLIIAELHDTPEVDRLIPVEELINMLRTIHGFELRDRYGSVCCFIKP